MSKPTGGFGKPQSEDTLRVTFSQVGVRGSPQNKSMISDLVKRFKMPAGSTFKHSVGYFDQRVTFACDVPVHLLPPALVHFTNKNGHASTSVGPWLLDTEEQK